MNGRSNSQTQDPKSEDYRCFNFSIFCSLFNGGFIYQKKNTKSHQKKKQQKNITAASGSLDLIVTVGIKRKFLSGRFYFLFTDFCLVDANRWQLFSWFLLCAESSPVGLKPSNPRAFSTLSFIFNQQNHKKKQKKTRTFSTRFSRWTVGSEDPPFDARHENSLCLHP